MDAELKDFISINTAAKKLRLEISDILFHALDGKLELFYLSKKTTKEALVPCEGGTLHHASPGEFIHQYLPLLENIEYVDIQLGQPLKLNEKAINELILNQQFSEAELYKQLAPPMEEQSSSFWKTEREVYEWEKDIEQYTSISLDQVQLFEPELARTTDIKQKVQNTGTDNASNTALKVIGLLMHHLAKSPRYVSGTSPNKSQIKELLIDLAEELNVNNYGLSKVDERLLANAMNYLESQKN